MQYAAKPALEYFFNQQTILHTFARRKKRKRRRMSSWGRRASQQLGREWKRQMLVGEMLLKTMLCLFLFLCHFSFNSFFIVFLVLPYSSIGLTCFCIYICLFFLFSVVFCLVSSLFGFFAWAVWFIPYLTLCADNFPWTAVQGRRDRGEWSTRGAEFGSSLTYGLICEALNQQQQLRPCYEPPVVKQTVVSVSVVSSWVLREHHEHREHCEQFQDNVEDEVEVWSVDYTNYHCFVWRISTDGSYIIWYNAMMMQCCNGAILQCVATRIVTLLRASVQSPSALTGTNSRCPLHRPEARRHPRQWTVEATSNFVICSVWMYHRIIEHHACYMQIYISNECQKQSKFCFLETNPDFWPWKLYFCNTHAQAIYIAYIIYVYTYMCIQLFIHLWSRQAGAKFH